MKKVEERDGKMYIDGVEYIKTRKVFMGVDIKDFETVYRLLDGEGIKYTYQELSRVIGGRYPYWITVEGNIDKDMALAIKKLIQLGLKSLEDNKNDISWTDTV